MMMNAPNANTKKNKSFRQNTDNSIDTKNNGFQQFCRSWKKMCYNNIQKDSLDSLYILWGTDYLFNDMNAETVLLSIDNIL